MSSWTREIFAETRQYQVSLRNERSKWLLQQRDSNRDYEATPPDQGYCYWHWSRVDNNKSFFLIFKTQHSWFSFDIDIDCSFHVVQVFMRLINSWYEDNIWTVTILSAEAVWTMSWGLSSSLLWAPDTLLDISWLVTTLSSGATAPTLSSSESSLASFLQHSSSLSSVSCVTAAVTLSRLLRMLFFLVKARPGQATQPWWSFLVFNAALTSLNTGGMTQTSELL